MLERGSTLRYASSFSRTGCRGQSRARRDDRGPRRSFPEPLEEHEEGGNQQEREEGGGDHAADDGIADGSAAGGAGAAGDDQGQEAEDGRERGHQDGAEPSPGRLDRRIADALALRRNSRANSTIRMAFLLAKATSSTTPIWV
jgi:hypothetical protein